MSSSEVDILKRSLERQKKARQQAEKILEQKSKDLYDITLQLQDTNERLENLLSEKTSELEGVFINIVDPYVVIDIKGNILKMNQAAVSMLGYNNKTEEINLNTLIHPDYVSYTKQSFKVLYTTGTIKNYRAKIITKDGSQKRIQLNASIIYNKNKKPIAAQGILRDITNEEEIKQLLAEQKKQLDIIVENSPLGIILTVHDKVIKANTTVQNYLGYTENEMLGMLLKDIASKKNQNNEKKLIDQMDSGILDKYTISNRYMRKDGSSFLAKISVSAVKNKMGFLEYKVFIIEDITKQHEAENQLKESESRLSSLITNLHLGVLLEDENRNIVLSNQKFCDLFKLAIGPNELLGTNTPLLEKEINALLKTPTDIQTITKNILSNKKTVLAINLELLDGRAIEFDYVPILSNKGHSGNLWIFNDVTIRNNYKLNLEIQKEKYSSIIANMNLGLIEVDNDDKILLVNQSFSAISGFTEQELLGRKAMELLEIKNKNLLIEKSKARLKHISDSYEIQVKNKKGEWRYWLISGAPRYDEVGNVIGSIGIHLDITNQKQFEIQKEQLLTKLEANNESLQNYAHIVSHDLKSPLRSLHALLSWMKEDYQDVLDQNGVNQLQMMEEKVEAMDKLINGILQYSSIQSDNLNNEVVDINEVVKEICEIIYIPSHVKVEIVHPLPTIVADRTKVHQLFQNIISNAVVNIEREVGLVQIESKDTDTHWTFRIKDNGIGIPEEYYEKVFQVFQSIGDNKRSTGIGLSIVKKIVQMYKGEICLDSKVGEGTEFYFTLSKE